ncbi:hypothetical protein Zmor_025241 [Zophobas morio]|uniref:APOPT family protein CG14806, mitochondrial n=1 Tax=Zophobas morio TaxID=2755281 RepID=A0AA38HR94_9CUCU|nr:hypothetical protein Zmor_025241 [Zophobas morio]
MLSRYSNSVLRTHLKFVVSFDNLGSRHTFATRNNEQSQPLFEEKYEEDPVIVMSEKNDVDIIGAPDSISNLRPIIRKKLGNETALQRQLREMQNATQEWNQEFWANHNANFIKERQRYINQRHKAGEKTPLSAEEMSEFYKSFLDKNWERHLKYNFEWYRKNFALLILAFRVGLEKNLLKVR